MNELKFSVAMSVYYKDNPDFFDIALKSITEDQTVLPNEIVLVADGPVSDELNSVIDKYEKKYAELFNVVRLPENKGLGNALKVAVENCKYDLIARMDSDDISLPTRFEEQIKYFSNNTDTDIIGGDITEFIDSPDNIVGKRAVPMTHHEICDYMKTRCECNHMSVMYKKDAVQKSGGYLDWFWNEDYYLWIRMMEHSCIFANTGTVLVNVRVGKDMYQRRGGKKYYISEKNLQKYMLEKKIISKMTYHSNVLKRWIIQIALPNSIRGWVFRTFTRKK